MGFSATVTKRIARAGRHAGMDFVRLFGSGVASVKKARDIDLAIGSANGRPLDLPKYSAFVSEMEDIFKKSVDVVQLKPGLSPILVREISARSISLWEDKTRVREAYAELMDRLMAVAADELIAFPPKMRKLALKESLKALTRTEKRTRVP